MYRHSMRFLAAGIAIAMTAASFMPISASAASAKAESTAIYKEILSSDEVSTVEDAASVETETVSAATYTSELTGKPISRTLVNQRPIAVMIDDDSRALPHYGLSEADIVYELVNSNANDRITRLMAIYKDYDNVAKIGSIRSTRPTNILLAEEYNAVLCHDGGPYYNDAFFADPSIEHLSGGFTRVNNGKATEFTEFIMAGEVKRRLAAAGISAEYNAYKNSKAFPTHWRFANGRVNLAERSDAVPATSVSLPFANTKSKLVYNAAAQSYDLYQHGTLIVDGGNNKTVSFDNVIIMDVEMSVLDSNGYVIYNCLAANRKGYLLAGGTCIPITWTKNAGTDPTKYYTSDGSLVTLNPGKTYITMVPEDSWAKLGIS